MTNRSTAFRPDLRPGTIAVLVLTLYYLVRLVYFAVQIAPEVPPDESTHLGIIRLYAQAALFVQDSTESYEFGLVTRVPFLYHLVLGKLLALNFFGIEDYLFLRLVNVAISLLGLFVAYRLARRLTESWSVRILFVVMSTNTLMYTFLGASVSYDNLTNLLAVAGVYSAFVFLQTGSLRSLLAGLLWLALGCLTKITFLPLAVVLVVLLVFERGKRLGGDLRGLTRKLIERDRSCAVLLLAVALGAGAGLWLYGGNLATYGKLVPACDDVLDLDACLENRIFARNWVVNQFREDKLTLAEAMGETKRIRHSGDREFAVRLLAVENAYKRSLPELMTPWDYVRAVWNDAMKPSIYGIQAHQSMLRDARGLLPYHVILFGAFLLWVRGVSWKGDERIWAYLAIIALFYFFFLVGFYNYRSYLRSHAPFLGVQGRYLFPVIVPAYLVAARFLLLPFRRAFRVLLLVVVSLVFLAGDLPYFLRHATEAWYHGSEQTTPTIDAEGP